MPPVTEVCFFAGLGDCEGRLQRAHLIPKSRIRREFRGDLDREQLLRLVWHPSCWRWMCELHHHRFDQCQLFLRRERVPADVEAFAEAFDLGWSLDASYGTMRASPSSPKPNVA